MLGKKATFSAMIRDKKIMKHELTQLLKSILSDFRVGDIEPEVEISDDSKHGEYTSNFALKLSSNSKFKTQNSKLKTPMDVALWVVEQVNSAKLNVKSEGVDHNTSKNDQKTSRESSGKDVLRDIERIEAVKPGFINFFLTEAKLSTELIEVLKDKESYGKSQNNSNLVNWLNSKKQSNSASKLSKVMVEFAHPNTHKAFHIGHLRNITTGEAMVRLLESQGAKVTRVNYQGDVGMHIAKCLYGILQVKSEKLKVKSLDEVRKLSIHKKVEYLGRAYAAGSKAYDDSDEAKQEIGEINIKIYQKDPEIYPLYQESRKWSLDYFEAIYKRVGSHFDRYYFESQVYQSGKENVQEGLKKGIFKESDGAVIFPGEKFGLHNRVFITSEGNATYEAKDMGLAPLQFKEYDPDLIIHVVGPEQKTYFEVVFKALEQLFPETTGKEYHLIYGWVRLKEGKMSSRSGNVVLGEWLLDEVKKEIYNIILTNVSKDKAIDQSISKSTTNQETIAEKAAIAAVKYAFLKVSTSQEIAFDLKESVNINGDSGVYLLYTYARCKSVLKKAKLEMSNIKAQMPIQAQSSKIQKKDIWILDLEFDLSLDLSHLSLNSEEHAVARLIHFFPEIVSVAARNYAPNTLCKYLFDLSQAFNLFYQKNRIIEQEAISNKQEFKTKNQEHSQTKNDKQISAFRLALTAATAQVLRNGLGLLGIETLEKM